MINETIETNTRWSDAREWLGDRWDAVRSSVEEYWPLHILAAVLVTFFGWLIIIGVHDDQFRQQAITACSGGNAGECRQYVQAEASYSSQQTFLLDYKLATGRDLK